MSKSIYPSIPAPGNTPESQRATLDAMRQTMTMVILNAQKPNANFSPTSASQVFVTQDQLKATGVVGPTGPPGPQGVPGAGIPEAPNDSNTYGRHALAWVPVTGGGGGITDAPSNSTTYARNNATWVHLTHNDITDWAANVPAAYVLPTASTTVLGGVKVDGSTITISGGVISSTGVTGGPYLPLSGGTLTGPLTGTTATFSTTLGCPVLFATSFIQTNAYLNVNVPNVAATMPVYGRLNGTLRWGIFLGNGAAETGSNVGSDFQINAYSDTGALIVSPFSLNRSTGAASFNGNVTCAGNITAGALVAAQGSVKAGTTGGGYFCKAGQSGAYSNLFNLFWTGSAMQIWVDGTNSGTISITSDYRIKKDIQLLGSTWDQVRALKPISYTHKNFYATGAKDGDAPLIEADDIERWGFVAHELQETLIPSAATGVKDEENLIQSPNPWTVIATLTRALQEAMTRIEALESAT